MSGYAIYGVTTENLIGGVHPFGFVRSELIREISEALALHPNIKKCRDFVIEQEGSLTTVEFVVEYYDGSTETMEVVI